MRGESKAIETGWSDLCFKHREWQDMLIKGKLKMKKKINKDGKQYYDFDYSRYQYYYSYPQDHIGLSSPSTQRQFINSLMEKCTQNFSHLYLDQAQSKWSQIQQTLKPLQLYQFLKIANELLNEKINSLRLEKTLRIKKMKGLFGSQNQIQKQTIELIESQIRSFMHKQIRLSNKYSQMGTPLSERLQTHKSNLKTRSIDQLQFSDITKSDVIVVMRLKQVKQSLMFNCQVLSQVIKFYMNKSQTKLKSQALQIRAKSIYNKRKQHDNFKQKTIEDVMRKITQIDPTHFDNAENRIKLQRIMSSLDYISCFQQNVQETQPQKIYSPHFTTLSLDFSEVVYIPRTLSQVKQRLAKKIQYYFDKSLIDGQIFRNSTQHICYKVNNLSFLQLKVLWETYNYAYKKQEGSLIKIRSLMRKELQLIFSKHVNFLLNVRQHSMKIPVTEKWVPNLFYKYVPQSQKQSIMAFEISQPMRFKDPLICSFIHLLGVIKDSAVRQQIQKYIQQIVKVGSKFYEYKSLFYTNCAGDEKTHLINVLNCKLQLGKTEQDKHQKLYYEFLQNVQPAQKIDLSLLRSYYMLVFLRCSESRYQLFQILNAQLMCLIKVQSRIKLLWKKSKIPFEMTKEFLNRFTDPTEISASSAFQFVSPQLAESHIDKIFKDMYNEDADKDSINWKAQVGVEVRRRRSDNPLMEGKSVIYGQTQGLMSEAQTRIQFLCSQTIKKRQTFLSESKLTHIVDRLQLIFQLLLLQKKMQESKLKIMDQYCQLILRSVSSQGIRIAYEQMMRIFNVNNVVDLTQAHFSYCYEVEIQALQAKSSILRCLIQKQTQHEKQFIIKSFNQFKRANFSNSLPQISSLYYSEEIAAQEQDEIIEEDAQDLSESVISEAQSQTHQHNIDHRKALSQVSSSLMEAASQYHVKVSFQQILSKNSVQAIKDENNKKDEIMNRKKQKIINDSILGALLPRNCQENSKVQFHLYSHCAVFVMKCIQEIVRNHSYFPLNQMKALYLQQLVTIVQQFRFTEYDPILKPHQLTVILNSAHRTLNKFMEKAKNQGSVSSRSSSEHWLCINSKIMQKIMSGDSGEQIDQIRGLYLCLNAYQINDINFHLNKIQALQQTTHSHFKTLESIVKLYGSAQPIESSNCLNGIYTFQKRQLCLYRLMNQLKQSNELAFLPVGNYFTYFRAIASFDIGLHRLLRLFNQLLIYKIDQIQSLQRELKLMQNYQCCTEIYSLINIIPNLQNRVYLRKKIDSLMAMRKTYFSKQYINNISQVINACTTSIPKFRKVQVKMSLSTMSALSYDFQQYVIQIMKSSVLINLVAEQLNAEISSKKQMQSLAKITWILPLVSKHLTLKRLPNQLLFNLFRQYKQVLHKHIEKSQQKNAKLKIYESAINPKRILDIVLGSNDVALNWIRQNCDKRKREEMVQHNRKKMLEKYIDRYFKQSAKRSKIKQKLQGFSRSHASYTQLLMLRQWLQGQLLIFGCGLKPEQLIKFRKMLVNPLIIFPIFWEDNTKHIVGSRQLSKMKNAKIDAKQLVNQYKANYLVELHLKKLYRSFVQDLSQYQLELQPTDTFLVLCSGAYEYFHKTKQDWSFIQRFCDPLTNQSVSQVDDFLKFISNQININVQNKQRDFNIKSYPHYSIDQLKYFVWSSQGRKKIKAFDSSRRFIKHRLNQSKSLAIKTIKDEVVIHFYRSQIFLKILQYLKLQMSQSKLELQDFNFNFDKYVHQGYALLNAKQLFIVNISEKNIQTKGELLKYKDQITKVIINNQFYLKVIRQHFFNFCKNIIQRELQLRKILLQDLHNEEVSRDQKILKQTVNKILVPKVKLNPFLSSPLKIESYFFSGTLKLSYIDQFLNKLRNRAVMIQLAEGGSGYLLKVNQLDECVDLLCKSIVGFSQKQFSDRLRTIYQVIEDLKQRNGKIEEQNKNYKAILNSIKGYENKQIKSLLYDKLNDFLVAFYEHQKQHTVLINLLKSVQNKMEHELNKKYTTKIQILESENLALRQRLEKIKKDETKSITSKLAQAKDQLYDNFKQKAQQVLNKEFIQSTPFQQTFQAIEAKDSQILMKKLRLQKNFYELKIAKVEGLLNQRIANLQKKVLQQSKLQNLLLMEQQKNRCLANEVKELQKCAIENQLLKKQMNKKQQDDTMQKFRLLKVNQSLKGKLKRMQGQLQHQKLGMIDKLQNLSKKQMKSKSNFSVQVSNLQSQKQKRKSFHIKTQYSSGTRNPDNDIWKQKWLKSEKKLQQIMQNITKMYQHFLFTKNGTKLTENLKIIIQQYQHRIIDNSCPIGYKK